MSADEPKPWPAEPCGATPGESSRHGQVVMRFVSLADGTPSAHDGRYLAGYDPSGDLPVVISTADRAVATRFPNVAAAHREWRRSTGCIRTDGGIDRPLTAYTIEVMDADDTDGAL